MKTHSLLTLLLLIYCLKGNAQITFEPGYFIDNHEKKIECLIESTGQGDNPTSFNYKMNGSDNVLNGNLQEVKEFSVLNKFKYQRFSLKIDKSSYDLNDLDKVKNIRYKHETLFLDVLIEGEASLYVYKEGKTACFFFRMNDEGIPQQLIYKRYIKSHNQIGTYFGFRNQLWAAMKYDGITLSTMSKLDYKRVELYDFFADYNAQSQRSFTQYRKSNFKKIDLQVSFRPGIENTSLTYHDRPFGNKITYRVGFEGEFKLPHPKDKWSLIVEPTISAYKKEKSFGNQYPRSGTINYINISVPIGIRYYILSNEKSKLYANTAISRDFKFPELSSITIRENKSDLSVLAGIGYKHKNTFSIEARYQFNANLVINRNIGHPQLSTTSLIFGYIFPAK